jgi:hypothetical protein
MVEVGGNPYPANVDNMVALTNASKWRMGFNSALRMQHWWNDSDCANPVHVLLYSPRIRRGLPWVG